MVLFVGLVTASGLQGFVGPLLGAVLPLSYQRNVTGVNVGLFYCGVE